MPSYNIVSTMNKIIDRIKRFDIQHGQRRRDLTLETVYVPIICASVLFFTWGFAYGLLDTMNNHVRKLMELSRAMSALLAVAYYVAYPVAVFGIAGPLIKHCGYRFTFIAGLLIFGIGNFVMMAVAGKLAGMVAACFVVGLGVATLERSANPYVVRCGPTAQRSTRINFAQSFAGIGTVLSPLTAARFVSGNATEKIAGIVGVYQGIGCIVMAISIFFAGLFFRTNCTPEIPSDDEEESYTFRKNPLWGCKKLWWGALGNFCNMGCQVAVAQYLMAYLEENAGLNDTQGAQYLSVAQTAFVVGRFAFSGLSMVMKPRKALGIFIFGCMVCSTGAIFARNGAAIAMVVLIMLFEAPLFPTIFETATSGLDKLASRAEDIMISSICGGAFLSPLFGVLADTVDGGLHTSIADTNFVNGPLEIPRRNLNEVTSPRNNQSHATPSSTSTSTSPTADAIVINMTGTATAFSLVVAFFCVVALYILIINIYKPYKRTLDAARTQEKQSEDGREYGNGSIRSLVQLTKFKSRTAEDLVAADNETKARIAELPAQLRGGRALGPYKSELQAPVEVPLRPSRTLP
jgi:FHS family L-fucose permease-like MFS transporter